MVTVLPVPATSPPRAPRAAPPAGVRKAHLAVLPLVSLTIALTGCTIPTDGAGTVDHPVISRPIPPPDRAVDLSSAATPLAGRTVFLDPGHSGSHDAAMTAQVPAGRGDTKDCQTTGTATSDGYAEHSFAWRVVEFVVSRPDDTSVGSCVDERAALANRSGADAVVAVHADGAGADQHGFHVIYSAPPLNGMQAGPAVSFASTMRDALAGAGLTPSTYAGVDGLQPRSDLAGLNLAQRPSILVELGNMRSPVDAAVMTDEAGRARYARAVVDGVVAYLNGR